MLCKILFESYITSINEEKGEILSIYIETLNANNKSCLNRKLLSVPIETIYLVDATGDAKICEKLNCNFLENFENETQPMSLRFIMGGVDLKQFSKWLLEYDSDRNVSTASYIDDEIHLSTAYTWDSGVKWALKPLFEKAIASAISCVTMITLFFASSTIL